ncbi:MAG: DUF4855 domain-containing protein [Oscillospiraceae bacterium]|nr:DUF4855 domain-containing protein [Oscillospiraceae bacterium]
MGKRAVEDAYKEPSVTVVKRYYKAGVETGYMDGFNVYYIGRGPIEVQACLASETPYFRSFYDETYKFLKKTLRVDDIIFQ